MRHSSILGRQVTHGDLGVLHHTVYKYFMCVLMHNLIEKSNFYCKKNGFFLAMKKNFFSGHTQYGGMELIPHTTIHRQMKIHFAVGV